jgi:hypothetical protein
VVEGASPPEGAALVASDTATDVSLGYDESWLGSLLRPLLVIILVLCINVALSILLAQYAPGMGAGLRWAILGLGVVAAVIGVTSTTWLAHPDQRLRRTAGYRVAEIVLILLVARLVLWLAQGQLPSIDAFLMRPDEVFFDGPYLLTLVALLFTWLAAIDFTDDLAQLALQPDELHVAQTARSGVFDSSRPAQADRRAILRHIVARWVGWGIILIFIASALRMGVTRERFWTLARQDVDPAVISVIVIYFLCGLLMLSQGQLAVLRARWTIDRLPMSSSILRNWPIYTVIVLLTMALLALFLPLGDTLLISRVLGAVLDAMYFVVSLIFQLVSLLLILLFSLLPTSGQPPPPMPPPAAAATAPPPPPVIEVPPWIGGALFWTTMLFILALAAYFYFTDRQANFRWLRMLRDMLAARWQQLRGGWQAWRRSRILRSTPGLGAQEVTGGGLRRWWPLRWGGLNPEQQVRYLYFQLLDRAADVNKPRHESETPAAYAPRLSEEVGAQAEDKAAIEELTKAFVQVRYAGQAPPREEVSWLAQLWDQLRKVFSTQR